VNLELQTFNGGNVDTVTNEEKVDPSNHEPQRQGVQKKEGQEDETQVILLENLLRQSSDSLKTEVQARDLNREDPGTDSGSADTSTTLRDPSQNLSLVLRNVVCEESGAQPNCTDPEGGSDSSQQITFEAEVHQDGSEEVSESPEPPVVNPFNTPSSPMHSAEPDSEVNGMHVIHYTRPLADTNGESSQLLVTCMQPDSSRNDLENRNLSAPTVMSDCNGVDESSTLPLQNTDNSQAYLVVSDVNYPRVHPGNLRERCRQYDDTTNTIQYRQRVAHVVGGDLPSEPQEPNNDRYVVDNPDIVTQMSADNEHLTGDADVLRQMSTDSEESRG
jgi:hypothetical protein